MDFQHWNLLFQGGPVASLFAPQVEVPPTVAASEIARVMTVKLAWMIQATRKLHEFPRKRNHLNLPTHQFSGKQVFDRFHGGKMCWKLKGKWSTKKRSSRDLYRQMLLAPFVGRLESQPGYHPTRYRSTWMAMCLIHTRRLIGIVYSEMGYPQFPASSPSEAFTIFRPS